MAELEKDGSASVRKSCVTSRFPWSKSMCKGSTKITNSPFSIEKNLVTPPPRARCTRVVALSPLVSSSDEEKRSSCKQLPSLSESATSKHSSGPSFSLPRKLIILGKEAMQQREAAQKVALQALRDASATETLVRVLKMFLELSTSARAEAPAICFNQFLSFYHEIVQAVIDMEAIQAATSTALMSEKESATEKPDELDDLPILHEIHQNSTDQYGKPNVSASKRRAAALSKSVSFSAETNELKANLCRNLQTNVSLECPSNRKGLESVASDERKGQPTPRLGCYIKLAKEIESEAGNWFMEFLETALETGLKKMKGSVGGDESRKGDCCPQSLILKVINWVEMEQSDSSKRPVHPRAAQIARKLRIKAKNP